MIQKKSLKDAIQNPEIISVVGGLIGTVNSSKDGLMPKDGFIERDYTVTNDYPVKDIVDPGVYYISGSYSLEDIPSGWNSSLLLCYRAINANIHLIINLKTSKMCTQTKLTSESTWQDWKIEI